jgi:hypothetical protein
VGTQHDDTKTVSLSNSKKAADMVTKFITSPKRRSSRLPAALQFPLIVLLSFSLSSVGYSFLNEATRGELATIVRTPESSLEVALLAFWRMYVEHSES